MILGRTLEAAMRTVLMSNNKPTTLESVFSRCKKSESGCLEWQGRKHYLGYGIVSLKGRQQGAHRVVWKLMRGDIDRKQHVCHRCDNPSCVNPEHLFIGSHRDNMQDMAKKKRHNMARKTHCELGHQLSGDNLLMRAGKRRCKVCFKKWKSDWMKKYYQRKKSTQRNETSIEV